MLFEKIKLEPGEDIIKVVRKHWFIFFAEVFGLGVLAFVPVGFYILFLNLPENQFVTASSFESHIGVFLFLSAAWLLLLIMAAALAWTHYYLDLWAITDRRIIVIDQVRLFERHIGSFRLERLQDINIEINGIIATFLNFGTVEAETASGSHDDEFRGTGLPDPRGIKALIQEMADKRMIERRYSNSGY